MECTTVFLVDGTNIGNVDVHVKEVRLLTGNEISILSDVVELNAAVGVCTIAGDSPDENTQECLNDLEVEVIKVSDTFVNFDPINVCVKILNVTFLNGSDGCKQS